MEYVVKPGSEFQLFIKLGRDGGFPGTVLHDHRPLQLNDDDYQRLCHIPKAKVCLEQFCMITVHYNQMMMIINVSVTFQNQRFLIMQCHFWDELPQSHSEECGGMKLLPLS